MINNNSKKEVPQKEEVKIVSRVDTEAIDIDDENHLKLKDENALSNDGKTIDKRKNGNADANQHFDGSQGVED